MCLYELDSTCLGLNLLSPNELRLYRIDFHYSVCLSPLSSSCNRIFPLSVNCFFLAQKHGSPWSCQSQRTNTLATQGWAHMADTSQCCVPSPQHPWAMLQIAGYLQPSSVVCPWATRAASPLGSQS